MDSVHEITFQKNLVNRYTGTYQLITKSPSVNGRIEIEEITPLKIKFSLFVVRYGDIAETDGVFEIKNNKGIFHNLKNGAKNCTLFFLFKKDTLYINQDGHNGQCAFGVNVYVSGAYKKISAERPDFALLKKRESYRRQSEAQRRQIQEKISLIIKQYQHHPVTLKGYPNTTDSLSREVVVKYNQFLNESFRDSSRLISVGRNLWWYNKEIGYSKILKKRSGVLKKGEFRSFPKHWVCLTPMDSGYILQHLSNKLNPSIEITDSTIIINGPKYTRGRYIKEFNKIRDSTYQFDCFGTPFRRPDTCIFEILDPETKLSVVTCILHLNSRKVYKRYMIPIKEMDLRK